MFVVSRRRAAELLGVSSAKVIELEREGRLCRAGAGRAATYDADQVARLAEELRGSGPASEGTRASEVFRRLQLGEDLVDVVIACRITPAEARELHAAWCELRGVAVVGKAEWERASRAAGRPIASVAELIQQLEAARAVAACVGCGHVGPHACPHCVEAERGPVIGRYELAELEDGRVMILGRVSMPGGREVPVASAPVAAGEVEWSAALQRRAG